MSERLFALLIDDHSETFQSLRQALKALSVDTYSVDNLKDAQDLVAQCKPQMIFTTSSVGDRSWMSIQRLAETANAPFSVIVVGAIPDTKLYLSVMERGAFDFIAPPFERESLNFVVCSAASQALRSKELVALMAPA